jgi:rare lipoprotein A
VVEATRRKVRWVLLTIIVGACAACATPRAVAPPALPLSSGGAVIGVASWYGPGFNGQRTSSGEVYNQEGLTAASTLFPLGTQLRVTNLDNGRVVEVAVNDHGPYAKGRGIDLSHQAAVKLGMIGRGTAPVRMEVLATPAGGPVLGQRYFVQVGSFADIANARQLGKRLAASYPEVRVIAADADGDRRYRVRLGAYMDRHQAELRATSLLRMGYHSKIVTE